MIKLRLYTFLSLFLIIPCYSIEPVVITTWKFTTAAEEAWRVVQQSSALDAIEKGCSICEVNQCDGTVGYGGSPDENGETTLDAMIMDGRNMNVGAVVALRRIKNVISVARKILDHTSHSILAGDLATEFAIKMGFKEESLSTNHSKKMWTDWKKNNCQPNYWMNVQPDSRQSCGPYKPLDYILNTYKTEQNFDVGINNHDTIGMVVIDGNGDIAAGTSTNGMKHKIPGRVGDSPIPGSGAYADNEVGGAAATGDGDVMLRFLPSFLAVEEMRRGATPSEAAQIAISRIVKRYPKFFGGVVALDKKGNYGAACNGMAVFPFCIANKETNKVTVEEVRCSDPHTIQF